MKIAFYSESSADQAALAVFAEAILGQPPEPTNMPVEGRGKARVFATLDGVFRGLHYSSDAEALVVVIDSDDNDLHSADHDALEIPSGRCDLCTARRIITKAQRHVKPRQGQPELKVAIGLAVPAIEAWYLVGREHQVGEPAWIVGQRDNCRPFTCDRLKEIVYKTTRPSLELETERATTEAHRIISSPGGWQAVAAAFPAGFGLMAQKIRSWRQDSPPPPTV